MTNIKGENHLGKTGRLKILNNLLKTKSKKDKMNISLKQ
jgi:hypothetical protein